MVESIVKCEACRREGTRSTVTASAAATTTVGGGGGPFWDEEGFYHRHDPNSTVQTFSCSNGHSWRATTYPKCSNDRCHWRAGLDTVEWLNVGEDE
jgi:hypothetical protein